MSSEFKDWYNDFSEEQKKNYELCMKYPILIPRNSFTREELEDYDYTFTQLDAMPHAWRITFGEQWAIDVQEVINKLPLDERDKIYVTQIKEKYGRLETYFSCYTDELDEVIKKYYKISRGICIKCGKPATKVTTGWISSWCDDCAEEFAKYEYFADINEFYRSDDDGDN